MESFNGKLRDELLNRELFLGLAEARYVLVEWRLDYNHRRPHSAMGWQTPAVFSVNLKAQEDRADGASPSAMQADPPVGAAPLPPDQPARSPLILSQGLVQETLKGSGLENSAQACRCRAIRRSSALPSEILQRFVGTESSPAHRLGLGRAQRH